MDVSVIIVNYNTFELTRQCIKSVKDHTQALDYEVIVVDNHSTDRDPANLLLLVPGIKLIKNDANLGFARGINRGIEHAQGDFILLLNSDIELKNNAIEACYAFLIKHPGVAAVGPKLLSPDGNAQHNCQRFPSVRYKIFELFRLQKLLPRDWGGRIMLGPFFSYNRTAYPDWVWGTFFMFRKELIEKLENKKLAEDYFLYGEDMTWCKEFRALNYRIAFEPRAEVIHYSGMSGGDKINLMKKNLDHFMKAYYSKPHRVLIKAANFLLNGKYAYE